MIWTKPKAPGSHHAGHEQNTLLPEPHLTQGIHTKAGVYDHCRHQPSGLHSSGWRTRTKRGAKELAHKVLVHVPPPPPPPCTSPLRRHVVAHSFIFQWGKSLRHTSNGGPPAPRLCPHSPRLPPDVLSCQVRQKPRTKVGTRDLKFCQGGRVGQKFQHTC